MGYKQIAKVFGPLMVDETTGALLVDAAGDWAQHVIERANGDAIDEGTASNGVKLTDSSTPYKTARVTALKPSDVADTLPGANTGTIYIGQGGGDDCRFSIPLTQGQSMDLLDGGDLTDVYLFVASADDGAIVEYTD